MKKSYRLFIYIYFLCIFVSAPTSSYASSIEEELVTKIKSLGDVVEKENIRIEELRKKFQLIQQEKDALSFLVQEKEKTIRELKKSIKQKSSRSSSSEISRLQERVQELTAQLAQKETRMQKLQHALRSHDMSASDEGELEYLRESIAKQKAERAALVQENESLQVRVSELNAQYRAVQKELSALRAENEDVIARAAAARAAAVKAQAEFKEANASAAEAREHIALLKRRLQNASRPRRGTKPHQSNRVQELEEQLRQKESMLNKAQVSVQEALSRAEQLQEQLAQQSIRKEKASKDEARHKQELAETRAELALQTQEVEKKTTYIQELQNKIKNQDSAVTEKEAASLRRALGDTEKQLAVAREDIAFMRKNHEKAIQELTKQIKDAPGQKNRQLQKDLVFAQQELKRVTNRLRQKDNALQELDTQLAQAVKRQEILQARVKELSAQKGGGKHEQARYDALQKTVDEQESEITRLTKQLGARPAGTTQNAQVDLLKQRITQLQEDIAVKDEALAKSKSAARNDRDDAQTQELKAQLAAKDKEITSLKEAIMRAIERINRLSTY